MRPLLNKDLHVDDFLQYYWLKNELQLFCRENGLSSAGTKIEITNRIQLFLQTGEITKPRRKKTSVRIARENELNLETVISDGHKCSQDVRIFFKKHIPNFHFSTYIQNFFKNNIGKTYQDVVTTWYVEQERLKNPSYQKNIAPQFEYNQFTRDFFADPCNKGKNRDDAITAWKQIKLQPGDNKYRPKL